MRFSLRLVAAVLLTAGAAACTDTRTINTPIPAGKVAGQLSLNPVFSASAKTISASLADFGLTFDHVRVTIRETPDTARIVADTSVAFTPSSSTLVLQITVPVDRVGEQFSAFVQYLGSSGALYAGTAIVTSHDPDQPPPEDQGLILSFVGPGAKVKTLTVSPKPVSLVGSQTVPITIGAADSSGAATTVPPLVFTSTDESVAKVVASGSNWSVQSFGKRGQVGLTATTPTGIRDTLSAVVSLPAASIALVSGGAQTGVVGTAVSNPAVVQVNAADGIGVPGVQVIFAAPIGGSVGTTTATTDANGRASTTMTLATTTGAQSFSATAGTFSVAIPLTATAGPISATTSTITAAPTTIVADNKASATITVQARDQYGNAITTGGASIALTTSLGHFGAQGTSTTATPTDRNNGTYDAVLFSAAAGTATIRGTIGSTQMTNTATVTLTAPVGSQIVPAQRIAPSTDSTIIIYQQDATPNDYPSVRVLDASGNPVAGRSVVFSLNANSACTLNAQPAASNADGVIALDARSLTIPTVGADFPFSCQLTATASGFTAPALRMALLVQPSGGTVWTGHLNTVWDTRDNWTADTPSSSSNAVIPVAQNRATPVIPQLQNDGVYVNTLDVEDRASLDLNGHTLSVFQNISAHTLGIIQNGTVSAVGGSGFMSGVLPNVQLNCAESYGVDGVVTVTGFLFLGNSCGFDVGSQTIAVAQNFGTQGDSRLLMNSASAKLVVGGSASFGGGSEAEMLSDGTLSVSGDFSQSGGPFVATMNHTVAMIPTVPDARMTFSDYINSHFQNLSVVLSSGKKLTVNQPVRIAGTLSITSSNSGGTLALPSGLSTQGNGPITVTGTDTISLGGTVSTSRLEFGASSWVTLNGTGTFTLNGALILGNSLHLTINATGGVSGTPTSCQMGTNVTIDGSNTAAKQAILLACTPR